MGESDGWICSTLRLNDLVVNVVLGPNAGPLGRTPLGGRNWEAFSVDPYLSGQLIAETIAGFREAGVIASIKASCSSLSVYPTV